VARSKLFQLFVCVLAVCVLSGPTRAGDLAIDDAELKGTITLSHDLVRLGIASSNVRPDSPAIDARPLFQAALEYAQSHPIRLITVDRGAYYFLTSQDSQTYLRIAALSGLTIDLADSTVYLAGAFV
jgi:hypothetical protein